MLVSHKKTHIKLLFICTCISSLHKSLGLFYEFCDLLIVGLSDGVLALLGLDKCRV
jgi:hypothetical protein